MILVVTGLDQLQDCRERRELKEDKALKGFKVQAFKVLLVMSKVLREHKVSKAQVFKALLVMFRVHKAHKVSRARASRVLLVMFKARREHKVFKAYRVSKA